MLVTAANASEVERLTTENAFLRQEIERLKQELTAAEVRNGGVCCVLWWLLSKTVMLYILLYLLSIAFSCINIEQVCVCITKTE